jgi:FixJ family two-component response regulator
MDEQLQDRNVVVVDDDEAMNEAIERLLNAAGFGALTFPSGEALLEAGVAKLSHCLVLDINLPGVSGFELYTRLGELGLRLPVIFITAFDDPASRTRAENAGAIAYLTKPFPGQKLLAAIKRAIEGGVQEVAAGKV